MKDHEFLCKILDSMNEDIRELNNNVTRCREDIASLKVKASLWGAVSGAASSIIAYISLFLGMKK